LKIDVHPAGRVAIAGALAKRLLALQAIATTSAFFCHFVVGFNMLGPWMDL
jgi:hypothetical protein